MENISKIVISKNEGTRVGYVLNFAVDNFIKTGYVIVDEETENEYFLKSEDVLSVSKDYIIIESVEVLQFMAETESSLLGMEVIDEAGFSYGYVDNLKFEKNNCKKIITKNAEILTKFVKKIGKNYIFVNFKRKFNKKTKKEFPKFKNLEIRVEAQKTFNPEKVSLSSQAYIGKVCLQDIFGYNNERLISKGTIVTKSALEKVKAHDKLNQLFFSLKRD